MRSKILPLMLWGLSIICVILALKTSDEPLVSIFNDTWIDRLLQQFGTGNSLIFNLSIGYLVSIFFYLLVVWYPQKQHKHLIKRNFENHYLTFKKDVIFIFLQILQISTYDPELILKLSNVTEFRDYFKQPFRDSQDRWDGVLNGFEEYHLKKILVELEILMNETAYILNHLEMHDAEVFAFFKRLSYAVYELKNTTLGYDEMKPLSAFIWNLFGGYSFIEGCQDYDIVKDMIRKI